MGSHRAWKKQSRGAEHRRRKQGRNRVRDPLLQARIPCDEVLMVLDLAKEEAARLASENSTEVKRQGDPLDSWKTLQDQFLKKNGSAIHAELGASATLQPLSPAESVQNRFLECCRSVGSMPLAAYHGTAQRNLDSISERGLIIPGHHGVRVANGSVHGKGIYTARLGASSLSSAFCDSPNMFVCGVSDSPINPNEPELDTAVRAPRWINGHRQTRPASSRKLGVAPQMMGRFAVVKESPTVRHVGDAMVVFNESHVAPLFLASGVPHYRRWVRPAGTKPVMVVPSPWPTGPNPNARDELSGTRQVPISELNVVVWRPPDAETSRYAINVKRRIVRKEKQLRRHAERKEKVNCMDS